MSVSALLLLTLSFTVTVSLFSEDSAVHILTTSNFKSTVLESDDFWLVQFYAPWCGHCKHSAPEVVKAAQILQDIMKIGVVDMDKHREVGNPYKVQGFPTIKLFGRDKNKPISFESSTRTFESFVEFCVSHVKSEIKRRGQVEEL